MSIQWRNSETDVTLNTIPVDKNTVRIVSIEMPRGMSVQRPVLIGEKYNAEYLRVIGFERLSSAITHVELVRALAKPGREIVRQLTSEDANLWHMATGVCTEAGELLDATKRVVIYRKPVDRANVVEELGDLEFYMEGIRQQLGISREETLAGNIAKLSERYAALTYSDAAAINRADKNPPGFQFKTGRAPEDDGIK